MYIKHFLNCSYDAGCPPIALLILDPLLIHQPFSPCHFLFLPFVSPLNIHPTFPWLDKFYFVCRTIHPCRRHWQQSIFQIAIVGKYVCETKLRLIILPTKEI